MDMQRKLTGRKIEYRPMIEAEMSKEERERVYRHQQRVERIARIASEKLHAASRDRFENAAHLANWYCLRVETGREFAVEKTLAQANVDVCLPGETVVEVRGGKKIEVQRAFFPAYLLVRLVPSGEAFQGVKGVKHAIDFVGGMDGYHVVAERHVTGFMRIANDADAPRVKTDKSMREGDRASVVDGPFAGFDCLVLAVKWSRQARARVLIKVDGRDFEIESMPLAFLQKL